MPTRNVQVPSTVRSLSHAGSPSVQVCVLLTRPFRSRKGVLFGFGTWNSPRQSVAALPPPGTSGSWNVPANAAGSPTAKVEKLVTPVGLAGWAVVSIVVGSAGELVPREGPLAPPVVFFPP